MNAARILGIVGGLALAGALLWSLYLKSSPLPERTFERGLPAEAQNAKNPVPMKPTDAKTKLEKPAAKAAPAKAKDAAAKAGSAGTAAPAEKAAAPAAKAGAAAAPAGKLAEPKKDKPKSPAPAPQ